MAPDNHCFGNWPLNECSSSSSSGGGVVVVVVVIVVVVVAAAAAAAIQLLAARVEECIIISSSSCSCSHFCTSFRGTALVRLFTSQIMSFLSPNQQCQSVIIN